MATQLAIRDEGDIFKLGRALAASGYWRDVQSEAQAVAKILAGREMGFGPAASLMGVHIIEGKPSISAGLMASAVKGSQKYDYRIRTHTDTECSIEFFQGSESLGVSTFTLKDAETAKLADKLVWKTYRKNLLFARALSNGVRWHCPDVFQGAVYTPEEMGADVDGEGNPKTITVVEVCDVTPTETGDLIEQEPTPLRPRPARPEAPEPLVEAETVQETGMVETPELAQLRAEGKRLLEQAKKLGVKAPPFTKEKHPPLETIREWNAALKKLIDDEDQAPY